MDGWIIFLAVAVGIWLFSWLSGRVSDYQRREKERRQRVEALKTIEQEGAEAIDALAKEKSAGFPWLARAYEDYFQLQDKKIAELLERKSHPAPRAAETLRQVSKERRDAEKAARISSYLLDYCRYLVWCNRNFVSYKHLAFRHTKPARDSIHPNEVLDAPH